MNFLENEGILIKITERWMLFAELRRNEIKEIKDSEGRIVKSDDEIEGVFFFLKERLKDFLGTTFKSFYIQNMNQVLSAVDDSVTTEMDEHIIQPYTYRDITTNASSNRRVPTGT